MISSRMIGFFAIVALAILFGGCGPGTTQLPEGPRSFVRGEQLTIEGSLRYWPNGQTGTIYNLGGSARIYRAPVSKTGAFTLIANSPPSSALYGFGDCANQLDIQPPGAKVFALNFAVSKQTDGSEAFAGYAVESYDGKRDQEAGFSEIVYIYNGGPGTWIKGTCTRDDTRGNFHLHWEATYDNVYLYPGWNALVNKTNYYQQSNTLQDERHTLSVALDEVGYTWVFQDFYAQ